MQNILVLYYSRHGSCEKMAQFICRGIESVENMQSICKTVPEIKMANDPACQKIPAKGAPYATLQDLKDADGICLGSPTFFGNMPAAMKAFWDQNTSLWFTGDLVNKPASVFTSAASLHGGHESTLISMMLPLLHHGMIIAGLPYTESDLINTKSGGTPYGASHVAGANSDQVISKEEKNLCIAQGKRIALLAKKLKSNQAIT